MEQESAAKITSFDFFNNVTCLSCLDSHDHIKSVLAVSCSQNKVPLNKDPSTWMFSSILDWHHVRSGVGLCLPATDYAALSSPLQENEGQIKTAITENWFKFFILTFKQVDQSSYLWGRFAERRKGCSRSWWDRSSRLAVTPPLYTPLFITSLPQQKLCGHKFLHGYHTFVCTAACNRWCCITHLQ